VRLNNHSHLSAIDLLSCNSVVEVELTNVPLLFHARLSWCSKLERLTIASTGLKDLCCRMQLPLLLQGIDCPALRHLTTEDLSWIATGPLVTLITSKCPELKHLIVRPDPPCGNP
jgi:hypothetical protein